MEKNKIAQFFDAIAPKYKSKYSSDCSLHYWFFTQRLEAAINEISQNQLEPKIFDIGAGTGALYDQLNKSNIETKNYRCCDISPQMLMQSNIPHEKYYIGMCYDGPIRINDVIFSLGVVAYVDKHELKKIINWCFENLDSGGKLIITYSNKKSLNYYIYKIFNPLLKLIGDKDKVASLGENLNHYTGSDIIEEVKYGFKLKSQIWLNQSFFPLNHLFPKTSVKLGNFLQKKIKSQKIMEYLSSEGFLVFEKVKI